MILGSVRVMGAGVVLMMCVEEVMIQHNNTYVIHCRDTYTYM